MGNTMPENILTFFYMFSPKLLVHKAKHLKEGSDPAKAIIYTSIYKRGTTRVIKT